MKPKVITDDMIGKEEERSIGNVSLKVYMEFFRATGTVFPLCSSSVSSAPNTVSKAFLDYWLSWWAENKFGWNSKHASAFISPSFSSTASPSSSDRSFCISSACRRQKNLHTKLLARVLKMPMSFFDTTPSGAGESSIDSHEIRKQSIPCYQDCCSILGMHIKHHHDIGHHLCGNLMVHDCVTANLSYLHFRADFTFPLSGVATH